MLLHHDVVLQPQALANAEAGGSGPRRRRTRWAGLVAGGRDWPCGCVVSERVMACSFRSGSIRWQALTACSPTAAAARPSALRSVCAAAIGLLRKRRRDRDIIGVGFVLVELEAALDLFDRHHQTDDRFLQRLQPPGRHLRRQSRAVFGSSQLSNLALSASICAAEFVVGHRPHRARSDAPPGRARSAPDPARRTSRATHRHPRRSRPAARTMSRPRALPADCDARHETRRAACRHRHRRR